MLIESPPVALEMGRPASDGPRYRRIRQAATWAAAGTVFLLLAAGIGPIQIPLGGGGTGPTAVTHAFRLEAPPLGPAKPAVPVGDPSCGASSAPECAAWASGGDTASPRPMPNWANLSGPTGSSPGAFDADYSVAFDPVENCLVLFETQWALENASTWLYCHGTWTELNLSTAPPPDSELGMAYDAHDGYVVLFGGGPYGIHDATWTFQNDTWTNISSTAGTPAGRSEPSLTYDPADGYILMFGGWSGTGVLGDTWTFQDGKWSQLTFGTGDSPAARYGAGLVYDRQNNRTLLFGGADAQSRSLNDMWEFSAGTWTELSSGGVPGYAGVPVESPDGTIWTFSYQGNTSEYSNAGWQQLTWDTVPTPPVGYTFGLAFDPTAGDVIVVGASYQEWDHGGPSETWALGGPVVVAASVSPSPEEVGNPVNITAMASGGRGVYSYAYAGLPAGGGCPGGNRSQFVCTPREAGLFNITVTATDAEGNSSSGAALLQVLPGPQVGGDATPQLVDAGVGTIVFTVAVSNGAAPYSYNWTGLPANCPAQPPPLSCRPGYPGSVDVAVTVRDSLGQQGTFDFPPVVVVEPVVAQVSVTPGPGTEPSTVGLSAVASLGVPPYTYAWDFGDGTHSIGPNQTHVFPTPGEFLVQLVVSDADGAAFFWNGTVQVPSPLTLALTATPTQAEVGWPVLLSSGTEGGPPGLSYRWSGLPAPCLSANVTDLSCAPSSAGNYTVTVTVSSGPTVLTSGSLLVEVYPRLAVSVAFAATPAVCGPFNATLVASVGGGVAPFSFLWNFSDGTISQIGPNVSHLYPTPSTPAGYASRVKVTDSVGTTALATTSIATGTLCSSTSSGGPGPTLVGLAVGGAAGMVVGGLIVWMRFRGRGGSPRSPAPR